MIEIFLYSVFYSFCAFVPILSLYAVFMILTGWWEVGVECGELDNCDFNCDNCEAMNSSFYFNKQAD